MFSSSFPIGRIFGVDLRVHATLPPLLALALLYSVGVDHSVVRGFGLCAALLFGILVREVSRALAAAWSGLHLRALLIFPVGGVMAFTSSREIKPGSTRLITIVTPLANLVTGLILLGIAYGAAPHVQLFAQPWISAEHILRSFVWTQFLLGAVSLLPIASISSRALALPRKKNAEEPRRSLPSVNVGTLVALGAITAGLFLMNLWLSLLGGLLLLINRLSSSQGFDAAGSSGMTVRDALQGDYVMLSSSDTLQSALDRTLGSPQEVFPVVRGDRLVGSATRDNLTVQLRTEGDGYVQGLMTRTVPTATLNEPLTNALRRGFGGGPGELVAVVEEGSVLGILTPQGVRRAMQRNSFMKLTAPKEADDE